MSSLKIQYGSHSVVGNYRENNEDRVFADPTLGLFLVADGMGGQLAGEKASQMAVDIIPEHIEQGLRSGPTSQTEIAEVIRQAVLTANREIMDLAARRSEYQSMGTTIVLAMLHGQKIFVAGIGDSRAYLSRRGQLDQLTVDHSLAQALVEARTISAKEAREHRFRNILWKYLGSKEVGVGPDFAIIDAMAGDRMLLASDGLTGVVPDADILRTLTTYDVAQEAANSLVTQALDNDSHDNVSCIVIHLD
jgi:protein phosphatase